MPGKKVYASLAALLLASVTSFSQSYPNGLSTRSVDPAGDKVELRKARRQLDSVRMAEGRPTVALVLCGGGAKGAAQVGVLKVIEELDMPIDFICGTSIGGLVGGLYSLGYKSDDIAALMRGADWSKLLSDKVPPECISLDTRKYKSVYQLSFPFHYASDNSHRKASEEELANHETDGKLHIGEKKGELTTRSGVDKLASSLPSGYVYGLNVNNLLSSLSVGYHDSISFSNLPVPYFCVATDMVSCKTKYCGGGQLKTAMRSTMSIPALFSPVRTQGLVLVDGGTRNNFPVDIAKAVGADIIIGIDLTDPYATIDNVNNLGTILGQFVDMLGRDSYERNIEDLDVHIHPDLTGYGMLDFESVAIDTMIQRGIAAGYAHLDELKEVRKRTGSASFKLHARPAVNLNTTAVAISEVRVCGLSEMESRLIRREVDIHQGGKVTAEDLEKAMAEIQGTGAVESVRWSLIGDSEPYVLEITCVKAPTDRLGVGLRFDSEVWADVALHYGWNVNRMAGPKVDVHARLGISQSLYVKFMMDFGIPAINVDASISNNNVKFKTGPFFDDYNMDLSYWTHEERLYFSINKLHKIDFQAGFRNRYYNVMKSSGSIYLSENIRNISDFFGVFARANYNTLDRIYFPKRGIDTRLDVACDFVRPGADAFSPIVTEAFDIKGVIPVCERFDIIPDFHLRWVQDKYTCGVDAEGNTVDEYSILHRNFFGGSIAGRYVEHQIPFIGMDRITMASFNTDGESLTAFDDIMVLNLDCRVNVAKNWYVSALGGYLHASPDLGSFFTYNGHKDVFGAAVQGSYNSIFGPLTVKFHWCNRTGEFKNDWGVYLAAGFDF